MNDKEDFISRFRSTDFGVSLPQKDRLEIMSQFYGIVFKEYQEQREKQFEEVQEESEGFDTVFTPTQIKENILRIYVEYHKELTDASREHRSILDPRIAEIKKLHNDLLESCVMGGVLDYMDWSEIE